MTFAVYIGLGFVGKSGFEYSATEVFKYSNTYEFAASCFIKDTSSAAVIDWTTNLTPLTV